MNRMTRLAKILIFVNLVFSLVLAAFALGTYSNRINWTGTAPGQSEDEIKKRDTEIKNLQDAFAANVRRWTLEYADLPAQEQLRAANQKWYAEQLAAVTQGQQPINLLVFKGGALQLDQNQRPQLTPGGPNLMSIRVMDERIAAADKEIVATTQDIQNLIKQEQALSLVLNGGQGNPVGLRKVLGETQENVKSAESELQHVKKLRINGKEEAGSLLHRQRQLKARRDLLQKSGVEAVKLP